jgi:hypothetical protein
MNSGTRRAGRLLEWLVASLFVLVSVIAHLHLIDVFVPVELPRQRTTMRTVLGPPWYLAPTPWRGVGYQFALVEQMRPLGRLGLERELELVQVIPLLLLASLAVVVGSWVDAVRSRRALGRGLGFALCLASVLGGLAGGSMLALRHLLHGSPAPQATLDAIESAVIGGGWMVFGAWVVLALAGRGLPRLAKLDILGTIVGGVWLLLLGCAVG